jgi:hypothetical protein
MGKGVVVGSIVGRTVEVGRGVLGAISESLKVGSMLGANPQTRTQSKHAREKTKKLVAIAMPAQETGRFPRNISQQASNRDSRFLGGWLSRNGAGLSFFPQ